MDATRWVPDAGIQALVAGAGELMSGLCGDLLAAGYEARSAPTGAAALTTLGEAPYDLIFIDGGLPDCADLCRQIRARPQHTDLYITLVVPAGEQTLPDGVDDYLISPFDRLQLLARASAGVRSAQLHRNETRLRTLLTNAPGAIYRCANDLSWTMELISDDIERISGYPATDFVDSAVRSFASVIHPDDREMVERAVTEGTRQGRAFVLEYRIVRADGTVAWVRERGQEVHSGNGRSWLDGVIFDITEWKLTEDQLEQSRRQLAVADERQRIARELHDGVIQSLSGVLLTLQAAETLADQPDATRARLADSVDRIDIAIQEIRDYVFNLRPGLPPDRHLYDELQALAESFQRDTGIVVAVDRDPTVTAELAPQAGDILQIAREALSNVRRHAQATTCRLSLIRATGMAVLEIDDDGRGFDLAAAAGRGQGLRNLSERSANLRGRLDIESGAEGSTVTVRIPLPPG
ncbi:PAS domain S-box protein [Frankia sp. Hr75.2]|nr:PAS domain S-box protein [Frankia sp. Hr75.2]